MLLARVVTIDPLAYIALGFLVITVCVTLGLGMWLNAHMSNKHKKA